MTLTTTPANQLYGIPNCDQVRKARSWLATHAQPAVFHDFRKDGITRALVAGWLQHVSWEQLVNRKGTTWRALSDERKAAVIDAGSAIDLMLEAPSVIKRPVLVTASLTTPTTVVGFSDDLYQQLFKK